MIDTIERDILIAAPIERVWEIVTTPEHIGQWFGDAGAERDGDVITMRWEEHGTAELGSSAPRRRTSSPTAGTRTSPGSATRSSSSRSPPRTPAPACASSRAASPHCATTDDERERLRQGNVGGWKHELGDLERYAQTVVA